MIGIAPLAPNFDKNIISIDLPLFVSFQRDQIFRQNVFRFKNEMNDMWALKLVNMSLGDV